ncbi:hypothetical protein JCM3766R1_003162 [Sporobolomyces carnicolor]
MRTWTTTVAIALSLASLAAAESCVIQGASIGRFDLNGLRKKTDYDGISNPDGGDITMNFCGAVTNDPVAGKDSPPLPCTLPAGDAAGAYIYDTRGAISLGKYSTVPQYHNGQLSITYKEGAACPRSNARRSSLIYLQCDKSWSSSDVTLIDSVDDCFYVFTMKTPHACSQSGGFFATLWSLTVSLFWILLAVGAGFFVYSRFVAQRTSSAFPGGGNNLSGGGGGKIQEAVAFAKDMIVIVGVWALDQAQNLVSKFQNRGGRSTGGGGGYNPYEPLHTPASNDRRGGGGSGGPGHADYSSSAWKATTRTGPPQPPAKDAQSAPLSSSSKAQHEEETMPSLAGGGSLLDDDDDDEGDELTMTGTGGNKI